MRARRKRLPTCAPACTVSNQGWSQSVSSGSVGAERTAEAVQCLFRFAGGPAFEAYHALVAESAKGRGDGGIVDLAGAGFVPAWHVGDLNLPDEWQGAFDELDEVTLADLGVVEVEVHP